MPISKTRLAGRAADGHPLGAGALDGQVVGDAQLDAAQGDRPLQPVGEADLVRAGQGVGVEDRLAQRAVAAVGQVQDREGAGDRAVLQGLDRQRRTPRAGGGPAVGRPGPGERRGGPPGGQDRSE